MLRKILRAAIAVIIALVMTLQSAIPVYAAAIDVGGDASNRAGIETGGRTYVDLTNPANDTGAITSIEVWANTGITGFRAGTFYGSSTTYTCRDSVTIGAVTAGSKQTFLGLSCSVSAGDYMGIYHATGYLERDTTGFSGIYYSDVAEYIDPTDSYASYTLLAGDALSCYGTGTTSGGAAPYIPKMFWW